ncbi:MAG: hypothetical protein KDE09_18900, partial [Anaerolineales bacterium]|nr:hypothetical protein [Anaerolineales bacterium]
YSSIQDHMWKIITFPASNSNGFRSFLFIRPHLDESSSNDGLLILWTSAINHALKSQETTKLSDSDQKFNLISVMPSWYNAPSMSDITSGGPGGIPREVEAKKGPPTQNLDGTITNDTHILVLDSIPDIPRLHWAQKAFRGNWLMQDMLKGLDPPTNFDIDYVNGHGDLRLNYYAYDEAQDHEFFVPSILGLAEHHYDMADHGLFVASIIRQTTAPKRFPIQLIQVLNDQGVGTLASLLSGLGKAYSLLRSIPECDGKPTKKVLINCSFGLTIPPLRLDRQLVPDPTKHNSWVALFYSALHSESHSAEQIASLRALGQLDVEQLAGLRALKRFVTDLAEQYCNTLMFASVGNDSDQDTQYLARYPARFAKVIGVAVVAAAETGAAVEADASVEAGASVEANNAQDLHAWYSNYPDSADGYVYDLGGQVNNEKETAGGQGVIGLFTNPVYSGMDKNGSGWAEWAGTSFACALALSKLAKALDANPNSKTPREEFDDLDKDPKAKKIETLGYSVTSLRDK